VKNIAHKICNLNATDFHMHTSSFSDGLNTLDEIVQFAGKIWYKQICITDHSDASLDAFKRVWIYGSVARWSLRSYQNLHNDMAVDFGVEWDIIDKEGNTCFTIQWKDSDFCILSAHSHVYTDNPETITDATTKAIEKYADTIKFIAHPTCNNQFGKYYDLKRLVDVANYWKIPLELNAKSISRGKSDEKNVKYILEHADEMYLNSDAHNLADLQTYRVQTVAILLQRWYISQEDYDKFIRHFSFV